ncbi:MAG: hypothetical protein V7642_5307, partial [Burkholderiales bacterium]
MTDDSTDNPKAPRKARRGSESAQQQPELP